MDRLTALAAVLLALALPHAAPLGAQTRDAAARSPGPVAPPSADSLAAITSRGRRLARYDFAAWHATDAVLALGPGENEVRGYVGRAVDEGWTVSFGRFGPDSSAWLVAYDAREVPGRPDSFVVEHHVPARRDTGEVMRRARALEAARADFGPVQRPYNAAVLPVDGGTWGVYLMPAPTQPGIYPIGADVRYHVSADGRRILAKRQLHRAVIEFGAVPDTAGAPEIGFHTHVLDDVPEDTDVFHVITRWPKIPELVVTDAFVYRVEPSGVVTLLGRREDVLGKR